MAATTPMLLNSARLLGAAELTRAAYLQLAPGCPLETRLLDVETVLRTLADETSALAEVDLTLRLLEPV